MLKTLGVIEISSDDGSIGQPTSPPAVATCRGFGGASLLEWVARRVTDSLLLDRVVIVAPDVEQCGNLENLAPADVTVFRSSKADSLGRFLHALQAFDAQASVRIRVDSPLLDPALIDRLVAAAEGHPGCGYATYCRRDGRPALASMGVFADWCSTDAVRQADRRAKQPRERDDVAKYLQAHPEQFSTRLLRAPAALDRDDLRLSLRRQEDWEHVQEIFDALDFDGLDWQSVAELVRNQPMLRHRMAQLNEAESATAASIDEE